MSIERKYAFSPQQNQTFAAIVSPITSSPFNPNLPPSYQQRTREVTWAQNPNPNERQAAVVAAAATSNYTNQYQSQPDDSAFSGTQSLSTSYVQPSIHKQQIQQYQQQPHRSVIVSNLPPPPHRRILHFEPKELCDLILVIDSASFHVHTQILARSSAYFRMIAATPFQSNSQSTDSAHSSYDRQNPSNHYRQVEIKDIGVKGFDKVPTDYVKAFLHLLYSNDIAGQMKVAINKGIELINSIHEPNRNFIRPSSDQSSLTVSYFLMLASFFGVDMVTEIAQDWITKNVGDNHRLDDTLDWLVFMQTLGLHRGKTHCIKVVAKNLDKNKDLSKYPQWDQLDKSTLKDLLMAVHQAHLRSASTMRRNAGWLG